MTTLAINPALIQFIVLPFVVLIFAFTLYFFLKSRKNLRDTLKAGEAHNLSLRTIEPTPVSKTGIGDFFQKTRRAVEDDRPEPARVPSQKMAGPTEQDIVKDLKQTIAQQQNLLHNYLGTIEELEEKGKEELRKENESLHKEIDSLERMLERKETELHELLQQVSGAQKMAARIEEVYQEFDQLQAKMQVLEKQASKANSLAIELEDTRNGYEVIHKELARKTDRLEETMEANRRMKDEIDLLEDKLAEANLQRQQLQKKVLFLTDLNNDLQSLSETNKKMQTELRRIGELESMLDMMSEERDYLLRKKGAGS